MMQDIKKLFRQLYHQNVMLSKKIIQVSKDPAQEPGQWFNCLCSLLFKKWEVSLLHEVAFHLWPGPSSPYPPKIFSITHNLVREAQQDSRGVPLPTKVPTGPKQGAKSKGPVVVIRVSHKPVTPGPAHSDQPGQDQAVKLVCGSGPARLGTGIPTPQLSQAPSHHSAPGSLGGQSVGEDEDSHYSFSHHPFCQLGCYCRSWIQGYMVVLNLSWPWTQAAKPLGRQRKACRGCWCAQSPDTCYPRGLVSSGLFLWRIDI